VFFCGVQYRARLDLPVGHGNRFAVGMRQGLLCGRVRGFAAGHCAVGHRASFVVDHRARFAVTQDHPGVLEWIL